MIQDIQQSLEQTEFTRASETAQAMLNDSPGDAERLYALLALLQIDVHTDQKRDIEADLSQLEVLRARSSQSDDWSWQWYIQAWYTAPLVADHPIDAHYLYHLCQKLQTAAERQQCLIDAIRYGVAYNEYPFVYRLASEHNSDMYWLADTYYRGMFAALLAAFKREGGDLAQELDGLRRAAGTPLRQLETERIAEQYREIIA
ncbi:hypothetical protein JW859_06740 [bacterium]|nr:hypothetical protein [bacterium]